MTTTNGGPVCCRGAESYAASGLFNLQKHLRLWFVVIVVVLIHASKQLLLPQHQRYQTNIHGSDVYCLGTYACVQCNYKV